MLTYTESLNEELDKLACYIGCDFEGRFTRVRTEETNMGNWCADLCRSELQTDFGLSNGGSLRANSVFNEGPLTYRFINAILPMTDKVVKVMLTGQQMKDVLENGVSMWPKMDGRWPLTSGLKFKFDPSRPPLDRIIAGSLKDDFGVAIEMEKQYTLASKYFISTGKDGFSAFLEKSIFRFP